MATVEFLEGNKVRVAEVFTNTVTGGPVDPAVVLFKYEDPAGNLTTLTYLTDAALIRDSTGNYHVDIDCDEDGAWYWEWRGTGANQAADEGYFTVTASRFA